MLLRILIISLFSFKPIKETIQIDDVISRKQKFCGQWVWVNKDFEAKLLLYNTAYDEWVKLNNKPMPSAGYWFFPDRNQKLCRSKAKQVDKKNWIPPISVPIIKTSGVGERWLKKKKNIHYGIDIAIPNGTPIYAITSATVVESGWSRKLGNFIVLQSSENIKITYGHLSRRFVYNDEEVEIGQQIGMSGNTGWSTGPHLHLEMRTETSVIDPLAVINQ